MKAQIAACSLFLATLLASTPQESFAQSPVNLSATIGGGVLLPASSQLKGNVYSTYDYPLSKIGYSIDGKVRLTLPVLPFTLFTHVSYNSLSDDAVVPVATPSGTVNSKFTNSLSLLTVGLGAEYTLISGPLFSPYVGVEFAFNSASGKQTFENDIIPKAQLKSATRFGFDIGLGTMISLPDSRLAFDVHGAVRLANLIGKQFGNSLGTPGFGGISQTPSYDLNDAVNPTDPKDHSRSINYFMIGLGVSYKIL